MRVNLFVTNVHVYEYVYIYMCVYLYLYVCVNVLDLSCIRLLKCIFFWSHIIIEHSERLPIIKIV